MSTVDGVVTPPRRHTTQPLLPKRHPGRGPHYDLYPSFPLVGGSVDAGWGPIVDTIGSSPVLLIDGGAGVDWHAVAGAVRAALEARGRRADVRSTRTTFLPVSDLEHAIEPFLGGEDPVFGTRFEGDLCDLMDLRALAELARRDGPEHDALVVVGPGAALADDAAPLVYLEVPRNEQQFRARAGALTHLGADAPSTDAKATYKRLYFVEWPLLERHKVELWPRIARFADVQREEPLSVSGASLRATLSAMATAPFRARPWFEPGAWGGTWLLEHVPDLPRDVPNYAWSFELISPENGLLLEADGVLLETGFDSLMIEAGAAVLGNGAARFGRAFPIRFDYLDTVEGGNLSVQCHPRPDYMREHFGEPFTQDETYYILDATPDAAVYLGFHEGVTREAWGEAITVSRRDAEAIDVERFVQTFPARRGDFFLIPSGTVHASGVGNIVLEISATPYIFTFKMYDWLRLDLDGQPRPLNVERGLANLVMTRRGGAVERELVCRPTEIAAGDGWRREHLPTHAEHFYDVQRFTIGTALEVDTGGSPHVLNLVAGERVRVEVVEGPPLDVRFAETFVVPAAASRYRIVNQGRAPAVVVCAFLKQTEVS